MKLLLHACCGPCTLEPLRLLQEEGHDISIAYMNSNIAPKAEYEHRLQTLLDYAKTQDIDVVEGVYDPKAWAREAGVIGPDPETRESRCRACYRLRLQEAAQYAADHGFDGLATTLTVSPYQYTEVIHEELVDACGTRGLKPVFHDYREQYPEATRRSRALGMYRQDYCGCAYSKVEADTERAERAAERARKKAEHDAEMAPIRAAQEAERKRKRAEKQAYAEKRAAQRAALKAYKQAHAND
ncbi:epoxyqueuosine reductase QueH [Slackia heliotrinireducens]|jgi:predicted adenine nucleotide alpha hydrolase (AANH) superfamily ATPase|uniref:Epoxyqueuosine reductase QueH n=1 Tax=Slackia heliotrinireducens (strain ATCC 29202 / DSM 20476 / NCTC 11029 / RHS 1) TaxID=471855 RepID=C7N4D8_SLAHD|nr:epoxyqueuosine reductase QueH [Slackia heliotrinireducens]ACV21773.1 uncharacterized conserved protein [Slackia heliotrinireducens DSM 20476]VEG99443.1 Uncharacterized BCR, COG1636 [Slackia heliotrinireducens]